MLCTIQNGHRTNPIPFDQIDRVDGDVWYSVSTCALLTLEQQDGVGFVISFLGEVAASEFEADSLEEKNKIFRMLTLIIQINKKNQKKDAGEEEPAATPQPSAAIIKEGRLEKKGHSVSIFNWAMFVAHDICLS